MALLLLCLVKNDTVNGIMGKTQGVSNANNPPRNPAIKMPTQDRSFPEDSPIEELPSATCPVNSNSNSANSGGKQKPSSLQTVYSTVPLSVAGDFSNFTFCLNSTLCSKYDNSKPIMLSNSEMGVGSVASPDNSTSEVSLNWNLVSVNDISSGKLIEYMCHLSSISAAKSNSYSPPPSSFELNVHFTGSYI